MTSDTRFIFCVGVNTNYTQQIRLFGVCARCRRLLQHAIMSSISGLATVEQGRSDAAVLNSLARKVRQCGKDIALVSANCNEFDVESWSVKFATVGSRKQQCSWMLMIEMTHHVFEPVIARQFVDEGVNQRRWAYGALGSLLMLVVSKVLFASFQDLARVVLCVVVHVLAIVAGYAPKVARSTLPHEESTKSNALVSLITRAEHVVFVLCARETCLGIDAKRAASLQLNDSYGSRLKKSPIIVMVCPMTDIKQGVMPAHDGCKYFATWYT